MNPLISAEINKYKALLNGLRAGEDSHARSFAEGCVFGMETIAEMAQNGIQTVAMPRPLPIRQPTVKDVLAPKSEPLPDSGLFDKDAAPEPARQAYWPANAPREQSMAERRGQAQGINGRFAGAVWVECRDRGWTNTRGKRITDWDKYLAGRWRIEQQQRIAEQNG